MQCPLGCAEEGGEGEGGKVVGEEEMEEGGEGRGGAGEGK